MGQIKLPNIALYGKSGSGKSTVAQYLANVRHYQICSPGEFCRHLCRTLFGREDRWLLNKITDAVRGIDELAWIKHAVSLADLEHPHVILSDHFKSGQRLSLQNRPTGLAVRD